MPIQFLSLPFPENLLSQGLYENNISHFCLFVYFYTKMLLQNQHFPVTYYVETIALGLKTQDNISEFSLTSVANIIFFPDVLSVFISMCNII